MCRWPPEAGTLRCPRSSSPPSVPVPAPAAGPARTSTRARLRTLTATAWPTSSASARRSFLCPSPPEVGTLHRRHPSSCHLVPVSAVGAATPLTRASWPTSMGMERPTSSASRRTAYGLLLIDVNAHADRTRGERARDSDPAYVRLGQSRHSLAG